LINVSLVTSCVIDEGTYTGSGYKYITEGKIYLNQEHPILAKLIIGAGEFLYEKIASKPHEWHEHLPSKLLPYRFPIFILSVFLAILIYYWTKTLAGFLPAVTSLILYYFSPQIISNSTIATLDLPFTFFFFLSIFLLWRFGKEKKIYKKNKVKIVLTLLALASFFLFLRIVTPFPLYNFKYSDKFEENWFSFSFDDSKWTSFNQFLERVTGKENLYVRFWIKKSQIENSTFLLAADDCIAEVYVNERKIYESDCKDRFDADGFFLDLKEYLDREDNLAAVRVWNKLGGVAFNVMNGKESIDYILMLFGLALMISLLFLDLKQTLIGISIGLTMLTREGGISLLVIALIWFLYLSIKKRSWKFLSNFLLVCISSFLTLNIGYGFKTSGIYFLNFVPLPIPYLFYNSVMSSILHSQVGHLAYLLGEVSQKGWLHYYLIVFFLKTPIPLILLFIVSIFSKNIRFEDKFILILPILTILLSYSISRVDLGIRLILPIYPFIFVISSFALANKRKIIHLFLLLLISWYIVDSLLSYPFYLSYCNQFARGNCFLYLSDSNIDWGQSIYLLGELSAEIKIYCGPLFGGITPNLKCEFIDCENTSNLKGLDGYLAISQFELFVNEKCKWLKNFKADKTIGGSILLYDLKKIQLNLF
jgi:hypothetical protein